jgi:hypothetical protein
MLLPSVPHLSGIFLSLFSIDLAYNQSQWDLEFAAMAHVGISFVGVRAALQGVGNETAHGCKLGMYTAYYPTTLTPKACYQVDSKGGAALGYVLNAAARYGVKVHLAPVMPHTPFAWPPSAKTQPNKSKIEYYDELTELQAGAFADVWAVFPEHHDTIVGVYTSLEEWNGATWISESNLVPLATHYFEPLSTRVRNQSGKADLEIWASPYYVGNLTLHPTAQNVSSYASFWTQVWKHAPSFDWIALQDSMGWQGNSLPEVEVVLAALEEAGRAAGKQVWSNVELFEGWPLPCEYPTRCGRHPVSSRASLSRHVSLK